MSTTLAALRQLLSEEIGDVIFGSCQSTTTGAGTTTTVVDSSLKSLPSTQWIRTGSGGEQPTAVLLTSGTYSGEIRFASSFDIATGTITVSNAFTGAPGNGVTYELHRLAHPTLKEKMIVRACKDAWPDLYLLSDTEIFRFGDWLIDGHFEDWASAASLDYWTASGPTLAKTTSALFGGTYSCALSTTVGYVGQSSANNLDLLQLADSTPHFYARAKATTASQVRLAIYDGSTTTYSSYHSGAGGWELLNVTAHLQDHPTDVAFRVYYDSTASTAYIDDAGVTGQTYKQNYNIAALNLVNHTPNEIFLVPNQCMDEEYPRPLGPSRLVRGWSPLGDGTIRFTETLPNGQRLRIVGRSYITEPTSTVSTEADEPQTYIITAYAAKRLYNELAHNTPATNVERYRALAADWDVEARKRCVRYGMKTLPITRTKP